MFLNDRFAGKGRDTFMNVDALAIRQKKRGAVFDGDVLDMKNRPFFLRKNCNITRALSLASFIPTSSMRPPEK